jgi:NAD-dependent SIR2 family protein deacetylase
VVAAAAAELLPDALHALAGLLRRGDVAVLSGAGLSTESGIPDYRGPSGVQRRQAPMTYQVFTRDPAARQRYWARSHLGWHVIGRARPNDGHRGVADLQNLGLLRGIVTQNVDGLHQAAGAADVIELHGNLDRVVCLDCGGRTARGALHERLVAANADWSASAQTINPDGDVELSDEAVEAFRTVDCGTCGGMLKPDVVFFGETVPRPRVDASYDLVAGSRLLLVLGSSLTVMSGRRFVLRAAKLGVPVAIVNRGVTRGDDHADLRLDAPLGATLQALRQLL